MQTNSVLKKSKVEIANFNGILGNFSQLASQFLANTPVKMTRETYERELALFVKWRGQDSNISDVKFEDLLSYKMFLEKQYLPATIAKKVAALKSFFAFAKKIGSISDNPAEHLRVAGAARNRIPSYLTIEEIRRLIRMPDRRTLIGKRDIAIIATLANTGMRRSEI